jgi:hypothetical protein
MHLAHKAEHAVDRNTGAVVAVTLQVLLRNTYGIGTPRRLQGLPLVLHFLVALIAQAESEVDPIVWTKFCLSLDGEAG